MIITVSKDMEKREPLYIVGGCISRKSLWNVAWKFFSKFKVELSYNLEILLQSI
jgi:hypothetical protein